MAEHQLILTAVQADFFAPAATEHNARYHDQPSKQVLVIHRNDRDHFTYLTIEDGKGMDWDQIFELGWNARHLAQEQVEQERSAAQRNALVPVPYTMMVQTQHLPQLLDFLNPQLGNPRRGAEGSIVREIKVLSHAPGAGGDGPGPDLTFVKLELRYVHTLYYLAVYWERWVQQLEQEGGQANG